MQIGDTRRGAHLMHRNVLVACLAIVSFSSICSADALDTIVSQTQSTNSAVRVAAFKSLVPYLAQTPIDLRAVGAVTDLLVLETGAVGGPDDDGDYISGLITAVVQLNDTSTIPALVGVIGSGNMVPRRLAQYGTAALGSVLAHATDGFWVVRKCVMITLINMLSPQNSSLVNDPHSMAEITAALSEGALDSSPYVSESARAGLQLLQPQPPLTSGTGCNGTYGGIFNGNVNVSSGQTCIFLEGTITGNVQADGGNLILSGTQVGRNVQITSSPIFSVGPSTTISGNLQVQNLSSGTGLNQICGSTVKGNVQFQNNGTAAQIGSASPSLCAGNVIGGNLQVQNNTASTAIFNNMVGGNLQDQNNTASTSVVGNGVGGNLQVMNDTTSAQVSNNTVTNNLQCQNDTSITGGGNTASKKLGQCSAF